MSTSMIKGFVQSAVTVIIALAVIHYVAPASLKTHLGVS